MVGRQPVGGAGDGELGRAVGVVHRAVRRGPVPCLGLLEGQRLAAEHAAAQRRHAVRPQGAEALGEGDDGGNGVPVGEGAPVDEADRREELVAGRCDQGGAAAPGGEHVVHRGVEGQVEGLREAVPRPGRAARNDVGEVGADVPVLDGDALGDTGRSRGEEDVGEVFGAGGAAGGGCGCRETQQVGVGEGEGGDVGPSGVVGTPVGDHRVELCGSYGRGVARRREAGAEGDHRGAEALDGEVSGVGDGGPAGQQAHPAGGCAAEEAEEVRCQGVGEAGEFGVGQLGVAGLQCGAVRVGGCGGREPVVEGVPFGGHAYRSPFWGGQVCSEAGGLAPGGVAGPRGTEKAQLRGSGERSRRLIQR